MKKTILISAVLALASCGWFGQKKKAIGTTTANSDVVAKIDTETAGNYTVEDTVRIQLGGKLYYLRDYCPFAPADSITVLESWYFRGEDYAKDMPETKGLSRTYRFIVHNRHSRAHMDFEASALDSVYNSYMTDENYVQYHNRIISALDSVRTEYLDPAIDGFNGYWVYLSEYDGDYYLDNEWAWRRSFHIADSIVTHHSMDGPVPYKIRMAVVSDDCLSISFGEHEAAERIEPVDRKREVYRYDGNAFITPARAIHNFEIIEYANNTGDLI